MVDQSQGSSFRKLFSSITSVVDGRNNLVFPSDDVSVKDFWRSIQLQLDVDNWGLAELVGKASGLEVERNIYHPDKSLLKTIPFKTANSMCVLPISHARGTVKVAISTPFDDQAQRTIRFILSTYKVEFVIAPPDELELAVNRAYSNIDNASAEGGNVFSLDSIEAGEPRTSRQDNAIPDLARGILKKAIEMNASDIHLQPFIGGYALRFRVDGILERVLSIPFVTSKSLVRFFKTMGGMDSTNNLVPQDGSMMLSNGDAHFDLRISTLPVGKRQEKLVIRLLRKTGVFQLKNSNMSARAMRMIHKLTQNPSGVILFCGPTGSGKTTTLYSILSELNKENISIATVEDPIEYDMPGLSQTEVNAKAGLSFSSALRSLLRQDPDILLIGEIRDSETAEIALQSALTGHLVFSTLHTNDAISAIPRLIDLKVSPMILGQALLGIVSQRLLRKLCEKCKQPVKGELNPEEKFFKKITHTNPGFRAVGCKQCHYSGYAGRLAITEIVEMNNSLRTLISNHQSDIGVLKGGLNKDFSSLSGTASRRVISGDTTIIECLRVLGHRFWLDLLEEYNNEDVELESLPNSINVSDGKQAILLVGDQQGFSESLRLLLHNSWYSLFEAMTPDEGSKALKEHDEIAFVLLNLPSMESDEEYLDYVSSFRQAMAWSRLPALILMPPNKAGLSKVLHAGGATSPCEFSDLDPELLVEKVNHAISHNFDYRWK